jgi:hypothetical protein
MQTMAPRPMTSIASEEIDSVTSAIIVTVAVIGNKDGNSNGTRGAMTGDNPTPVPQSTNVLSLDSTVKYHTQTVGDVDAFYREAGNPRDPTLLLLHGFPSSSHQFRDLIPLISTDFHIIAPDYPGFGSTIAPFEREQRRAVPSLAGAHAGL